MKEHVITKKYFTIGEVAQMLGVATSLLRFWEEEFDNINPKRKKNGNRQYTNQDIAEVRKVYYLVKERGFTLAGAKEELKMEEIRQTKKPEPPKELKEANDILRSCHDVIKILGMLSEKCKSKKQSAN